MPSRPSLPVATWRRTTVPTRRRSVRTTRVHAGVAARRIGNGRRRGAVPSHAVRRPAEQPASQSLRARPEPDQIPCPWARGDVARQGRHRDDPARQPEQPQHAREPLGLGHAVVIELLGQQLGEVPGDLRATDGGGERVCVLDAEGIGQHLVVPEPVGGVAQVAPEFVGVPPHRQEQLPVVHVADGDGRRPEIERELLPDAEHAAPAGGDRAVPLGRDGYDPPLLGGRDPAAEPDPGQPRQHVGVRHRPAAGCAVHPDDDSAIGMAGRPDPAAAHRQGLAHPGIMNRDRRRLPRHSRARPARRRVTGACPTPRRSSGRPRCGSDPAGRRRPGRTRHC